MDLVGPFGPEMRKLRAKSIDNKFAELSRHRLRNSVRLLSIGLLYWSVGIRFSLAIIHADVGTKGDSLWRSAGQGAERTEAVVVY